MTEVSVKVSSGLKMESVAYLYRALQQQGEEVFRRNYPCAFLVVIYAPPADIGWGNEETTRTTYGDLEVIGLDARTKPTKWAIPLLKSGQDRSTSTITLGRMGKVDIALRSSKISKHHASFTLEKSGACILVDAGSANGTVVNGKRMEASQRYRLKSGDMLSMWKYLFQFVDLESFLVLLREKSLPA